MSDLETMNVGPPPPEKYPAPQPGMGRIVLFHDARYSKVGNIRPAIVLFAREDGCVDLEVFGAGAHEREWSRIPPEGSAEAERARCWWAWPPRGA